MTSQLNVDTIVDKAGSGGTNVKVANTSTYVSEGGAVTQNTVQGIAKHWVLFQQKTSNVIHDSFNNSSVTDQATAIIFPNFTNNMSSVNYVVSGGIATGIYNGTVMSPTSNGGDENWSVETGGYYISCRGNGGVFTLYGDINRIPVAVHGDLA
jgi:hypothetical protein